MNNPVDKFSAQFQSVLNMRNGVPVQVVISQLDMTAMELKLQLIETARKHAIQPDGVATAKMLKFPPR